MEPKSSKRIIISVLLSGLAMLLVFSYQTILVEAGMFLAPQGVGKADVAILEGTEVIREDAIIIGIRLLSTKRAKSLVVVYQKSDKQRIFGLPLDYGLLLNHDLQGLGVGKDQIQIVEVSKEHPITLTEAQCVLLRLSKDGVRTAILVAEGFHTRRSLWTYRQVGSPLGIKITSSPYFPTYRLENWWKDAQGVREFFDECIKFFYYLIRGYIPVKSLLET